MKDDLLPNSKWNVNNIHGGYPCLDFCDEFEKW
jgi:hypothetical protein